MRAESWDVTVRWAQAFVGRRVSTHGKLSTDGSAAYDHNNRYAWFGPDGVWACVSVRDTHLANAIITALGMPDRFYSIGGYAYLNNARIDNLTVCLCGPLTALLAQAKHSPPLL
jgi:hypothetical protein